MGRLAKAVLVPLVILALLVVGARFAHIREGTRSVTIATKNGNTAAALQRNTHLAAVAAGEKCKDPTGVLHEVLGIRGPRHVVVRERTPSTGTYSFTVDCDTRKVASLAS